MVLRCLACLLFFSFCCACTPPAATAAGQPRGKPNVVLIVVDDLGWMDVGYRGGGRYRTPNIDRLSRQGVVFTDAYAGASNCAPSRAALLSGRYAPRTGVYTVRHSDRGDERTRRLIPTPNTYRPADSIELLPEYLRRNGYRTGTFGKWHLGPDPLQQGFDVNVGGGPEGNPQGTYFSPYNLPAITSGPEGEYLPDRLTSEAIAFVDASAGRPFFLYLPYYTVHTPLQAPDTAVQRYVGQREDGNERLATYDAMVELMDRNVGRLLDRLEQDGLARNTIVIFTSDNGGVDQHADQSPLRAGKGAYYEGGTRVPLIVRWPGRITPRQDTTPVINLDFYPTLATLTGSAAPRGQLDGADLSGLLLEEAALAGRTLFWHFPVYLQRYRTTGAESRDALFRTRPGTTLRRGEWKLHEYFEDGGIELYHLEKDPGERNNLAPGRPALAEELLREMRAWRARTGAPVPRTPNPHFDEAFEREELSKLGG